MRQLISCCAVTTLSQVLPWDLLLSSGSCIAVHCSNSEVGLARGQNIQFGWLGKMHIQVLHRKARNKD